MKYITKLLLFLLLPTIIVTVLAAALGFDSVGEMVKALIEDVIPFGNVVAAVMDKYVPVSVGKPYSFYLLVIDVLKTLISGCLFTFVVQLAALITGIDGRRRLLFPVVQCITAIFLAVVSGVLVEKLTAFFEVKFGNFWSALVIFLIAGAAVAIWVVFMHTVGGFTLSMVFSFLLARKVIPSIVINTSTYIFLGVVLVASTNGELLNSVMPIAIMIYGICILVSSLFESIPLRA